MMLFRLNFVQPENYLRTQNADSNRQNMRQSVRFGADVVALSTQAIPEDLLKRLRTAVQKNPYIFEKTLQEFMALPVSDAEKFPILMTLTRLPRKTYVAQDRFDVFRLPKLLIAIAQLTDIPMEERIGVLRPYLKEWEQSDRQSETLPNAVMIALAALPDFDDKSNSLRVDLFTEFLKRGSSWSQADACSGILGLNLPSARIMRILKPLLVRTENQYVIRACGTSPSSLSLEQRLQLIRWASDSRLQKDWRVGPAVAEATAAAFIHYPELGEEDDDDGMLKGEVVHPHPEIEA